MKNYKRLIVIPFLLMVFCIRLMAQSPSEFDGIYLTCNDYKTHKLSYTLINKNDKLSPREFFKGNSLIVISDGKRHVFLKNSVYGYHNSNRDYRLYKNTSYIIEDSLSFCLYSHNNMVQQGKRYNLKKEVYFSTDAGSEILPLNIENLNEAFPKNYKFRFLAGQQYKAGANINAYDYRTKEYKIKELYAESKRND